MHVLEADIGNKEEQEKNGQVTDNSMQEEPAFADVNSVANSCSCYLQH